MSEVQEVVLPKDRADALLGAERLFNELLNDPASGLGLKRRIKEKFPQANLPDLTFAEQVTKPYDEKLARMEADSAAQQKLIDELRQGRETDIAERKLREQLDKVRGEYNFTDDKMAEVVETMKTRGLAHDPDAAAALVAKTLPKATPMTNGSWTLPPKMDVFGLNSRDTDKQWDQLHTQPWDFFDEGVREVMNDPIWGQYAA